MAGDALHVDICVIGAGAAGLMAGIHAARTLDGAGSVLVVDGAKKVGAKILVAGGGRCNVTHHRVSVEDYRGSSPDQIKKVLRAYPVAKTRAFFADLGGELKQEETGKLFPTTDKARTVLDALLGALDTAGGTLWSGWRVGGVERTPTGFRELHNGAAVAPGDDRPTAVECSTLILATGGKALPKTGSDGFGYKIAQSLGHTITARVFPALVPIITDDSAAVRIHELSGLSTDAEVRVVLPSGKRVASETGSALCTHFGLSGPSPMNGARYLLDTWQDDNGARLRVNWRPGTTSEEADAQLLALGASTPLAWLRPRIPERLTRTLCATAGVEPGDPAHRLTKDARRALVGVLTDCDVEATGDRGYAQAEATAGGVPLDEVDVKTMASRLAPGGYIVGELCDVDGRIGGFNFQWAWSSGFVGGTAAAKRVAAGVTSP